MLFLIALGCLHAAQTELTNRCQRYGISLNDCLNSTYLPRKEYDEYLQSFNMPIVRDENCTRGRCVAFVYRDPNGSADIPLRRELSGMEARLRNEIRLENTLRGAQAAHVVQRQEPADVEHGSVSRKTDPVYKSLTVVETKTETVSEGATRERVVETRAPETKTVFRTVDVARPRMPSRVPAGRCADDQSCDEDSDSGHLDAIPSSVRRPGESSRDPDVVTVTRVFYKTVSVDRPITLYREVTTTVKNEVPVVNYKVTTVREVSTVTTDARETMRRASGSGSMASTVPKTVAVDPVVQRIPERGAEEPGVTTLTVTKTQDRTVFRPEPATDAKTSASACSENSSMSLLGSIGERVTTRIVTETKTVPVPASVSIASDAHPTRIGKASRQEIAAELVPLIREILLEGTRDGSRHKHPEQTVTKVVTAAKGRVPKTVYNTVYIKKPRCRAGMEGQPKVCEDETTTTVYV